MLALRLVSEGQVLSQTLTQEKEAKGPGTPTSLCQAVTRKRTGRQYWQHLPALRKRVSIRPVRPSEHTPLPGQVRASQRSHPLWTESSPLHLCRTYLLTDCTPAYLYLGLRQTGGRHGALTQGLASLFRSHLDALTTTHLQSSVF